MSLVNRYVDPDESGLADGTSPADAYPSQVVFQAAEFTDLVTATDNWILHCFSSAGTADTSFVNYTGWTMSAAFDLVIQVDEGDWGTTGIYDTSAYRMEVNNANCISISSGADFVTYDHLQFEVTSTSSSRRAIFCNPADGAVIKVTNNVFTANISSSPTNDNAAVWMNFAGSGNRTLSLGNNILYNWVNSTENVLGSMQNSGWTSYQYRNTLVDCFTGLRRNGGTAVAKANIVQGSNTSFMGSFDASSDYNSTDTGTATGGANDRVSQTFTFVDAVNDDYHLSSSDTGAKGFGVDLSADANFPISVDIDNDAIATPFDIGADEFEAAGAALLKILNEIEQITEANQGNLSLKRILNETINITESILRFLGFIKIINETINITENLVTKLTEIIAAAFSLLRRIFVKDTKRRIFKFDNERREFRVL